MNTKYLNINCNWHCRRAGGLFLGLRLHFPCSVCPAAEPNNSQYQYHVIVLRLGLLLATVNVEFKYNHVKMLPQ